jgi:hypothetical protein
VNIEALVESLISQGLVKREEVESRINDYAKKATVKLDVDHLGNSVVDLLLQVKDLEKRVAALEGTTVA